MKILKPGNMWLLLTAFLMNLSAQGQASKPWADSTYVMTFDHYLNTRFYFSQKYISLRLASPKAYELNYLPNTSLNMGVGATYKWATLNLAYGFHFLNGDDQRGKTKWLDLQTHQYFRKFSFDVFSSYYSGLYLAPAGKAAPPGQAYYIRPDLSTLQLGASVQYIFNYNKFSYRALFLQNEWQMKSAGSPLIGVELFIVRLKSDSTMIPTVLQAKPDGLNTTRFISFEAGPNAGYAYTYVIHHNFYLSVSGSVSFGLVANSLSKRDGPSSTAFSPNFYARLFAGYNSRHWAIGVSAINSGLALANANYDERVTLHSGNIRFNYVYRFLPSKMLRHALNNIVD